MKINRMQEELSESHPHVLSTQQIKAFKNNLFLSDLLSFKEQPIRIKHFSLAYSDTLVYIKHFQNKCILIHLSQQGQILWMKVLPREFSTFSMPTDQQVLFIDTKKENFFSDSNQFVLYNLRDKSVLTIPLSRSMRLIQPHIFCDTKLLCVVGKTDNKLRIRYYEYDGLFSNNKELVEDRSLNYPKEVIKKLNNHSKVGWIKQITSGETITFNFFELDSQKKQKVSQISVMLNTPTFNIESLSLIKAKDREEYLLKAHVYFNQQKTEGIGIKNNNFKSLLCCLNNDGVVKEEIFYNRNKPISLSEFAPVLCYPVGQLVVLILTAKSAESILMFVNPNTRQILSVQEKSKGYLIYSTPHWNNHLIIEKYNTSNSNALHLKLIYCSLPPMNDIYLHWLLNIDDDFDDDLLQDAVDLLIE